MSVMLAPKTSRLWEVDGQKLRVRFHEGQQAAWDSLQRFVFMIAGTQSGKTAFGPLWLWREIKDKGAGDYLAVTSTFPLLKLKMLPEFLTFFDSTLHLGTWHASDKVYVFHDNQTRVIFGSATHPNSLESATAKAAWLDEAGQDEFRLGSWEAILRRLALNQGRTLLTTTPYNLGWLKQQVYDRWRDGDADYVVIQFASTANPAFPLAEYERAKRTMPDWRFRMFYRGEFTRPAGLIYSDFIDAYRHDGGHLVRPFAIPPSWPRYGGVDFGAVHFARLACAHDPNADVYYLYDESLSGDKTTAQHAAELKVLMDGTNWQFWCGGAKSEVQQRRDFGYAGVGIQEPQIVDVEAGIDRVIALFKEKRLYVFDTLRGLRDELGTYSRVVDESGQPTEEIKDKATFHRIDALRYLAIGLDSGVSVMFL